MADDRLVASMADVLDELRHMRQDTNDRLGRLEQQQMKTNLGLNEMRLSNRKPAERIEEIVNLDQRVRTLENIVLPKAS